MSLTLDSFLAQDYPHDRYEIIVADNNSMDDTSEVVARYACTSAVSVNYIFEQRQGVHYARNSAAKISTGEILYFTDDDMLADKGLLKEIIKPFGFDDKVAAVTGTVLPKWEVPPPQWVQVFCMNGLLSLNIRSEELLITGYDCGVYSCHQAIRRDVFFMSGGFNPENTAGEWIGDGETGLNLKIKALGYKFAFIASSTTYHIIPSARMTQSYLNKRYENQGCCDCYTDYRENRYEKSALKKIIYKQYWECLKTYIFFVKKVVCNDPEWRFCRARFSYYVSRIKYNKRLIFDEKWRTFVLKNDWLL